MSKEAIKLTKAISRVMTGRHKINKYPMFVKQKLIEDKNCCICMKLIDNYIIKPKELFF